MPTTVSTIPSPQQEQLEKNLEKELETIWQKISSKKVDIIERAQADTFMQKMEDYHKESFTYAKDLIIKYKLKC